MPDARLQRTRAAYASEWPTLKTPQWVIDDAAATWREYLDAQFPWSVGDATVAHAMTRAKTGNASRQ